MELITRTAKLIPYGRRPRRLAGFVTAYNHEPMADDQAASHGNLYVVIEVLTGGRQSEDTADLIIETFGQHYYDSSYEANAILDRFEHALKATNRELANFIGQGNAAWVGKLSAVIAVQHGTELHLAHAGSAEAYLYRGKSSAKITGPAGMSSAPSKTFGTVTSGELEDGDRLLLSTPALFHQLQVSKLKSIITGASPSGAVSEITQILESAAYAQIDRIAVILVEMVSTERAASQPLTHEPAEVVIGTPETAIEAVKYAAAPIALATAQQAKTAHDAARTNWDRSKPHVAKARSYARDGLGHILKRPRHAMIATGATVGFVLIGGGIAIGLGASNGTGELVADYGNAYSTYKKSSADGSSSRSELEAVRATLAQLSPGDRARLEKALSNADQAPGAPRQVSALELAVQARLDEVDNLTRVDGKLVASTGLSDAKALIELTKEAVYIVTQGKNPRLIVVNLSTLKVSDRTNQISKISDVTTSTISQDKRGLYLLSEESGLWFYDFVTGIATKQTIADSGWEPATAIASYATNIYTLSNGKIYKHTKNLSGYSPKTIYADAPGATGIAIDGSVVVGYSQRVERLSGGTVNGKVAVPEAFGQPSLHISTDNSSAILADRSNGRIGIISLDEAFKFKGQYLVNGQNELHDAECNISAGICYALSADKLVSFPVSR